MLIRSPQPKVAVIVGPLSPNVRITIQHYNGGVPQVAQVDIPYTQLKEDNNG